MPTPNPDPRRERIATAALAGMLANPEMDETMDGMVSFALRYADALIAELDREEEA